VRGLTISLGLQLDQFFSWTAFFAFIMGSPITEAEHFSFELPQHEVTISRGLYDMHGNVWEASCRDGSEEVSFRRCERFHPPEAIPAVSVPVTGSADFRRTGHGFFIAFDGHACRRLE